MANDERLYFHGTLAAGSTMAFTAPNTVGASVDLGSNTVNRTIEVVSAIRSVGGAVGGGTLTITFHDSTDDSTFSAMGGTAGIGIRARVSSNYASTDAVAPTATEKVVLKTDKRYVRAHYTISSSGNTFGGVTVIGKVLTGAFSGALGNVDM